MFRKVWENEQFWSIVGYATLAICVACQIIVGYVYLVAQFGYLTANILGVARDFALGLPNANKVKDIVFTAITVGLIVIRMVG